MTRNRGPILRTNGAATECRPYKDPSTKHKLLSGFRLRSFCRRRRRTIVNEAHPTNHHLFPRLVAPFHCFGWIRVVLVVSGVVEMCNTLDPGSFGNRNWIFEYVIGLPTEIVTRHGE